ncbi:PREDICTED: uncharacterized protein LOC109337963 [Lupinus angustifolius]|uniref:uncharacterized protein LOC109337963 n=1 Tax=Lupinus angustifolius TaxID=3871 RepID=UPI00092EC83F|nr:PREDICTED: uncharacterized protein LOC109337963 [Lupinus angustifolius]
MEATEQQRATFKDAKKKDNKALFLIHQCVDDVHFEKIQNATTAKEAWDTLIRSHVGGEKIKKMKGFGELVTDLMIIEKIMRSFPQKFDFIIVANEESKDVNAMKIEELQSSLEAHEMRMLERNPIKKSEQALKASHFTEDDRKRDKKWKGKQHHQKMWPLKSEKNKPNHDWPESYRGGSRMNKKGKRFDKKKVECFNCHKMRHYSCECHAEKARGNEEVYAAQEDSDQEPLNLMVTTSGGDSQTESWYLDSGCLNHMTKHKEWLTNFDSSKKSKVKFADDSSLEVEGMGNVIIKRQNGSKAMITEVLYVPYMKCNLLSIGQLVDKGFSVLMKDDKLELFDTNKNLVIRSRLTRNRTFQVDIKAAEVQCLAMMEASNESWL